MNCDDGERALKQECAWGCTAKGKEKFRLKVTGCAAPLRALAPSDSHFIFKNEIISSKRAFSMVEEGKSNYRRAWERAGEGASYDFGYGFA